MKQTATFHPVTDADVKALALDMRDEDALEVQRSSGFTPLEAIERSIAVSDGRAFAARIDGDLVAVFGIVAADMLGGVGVPWLLTSKLAELHRGAFLRSAKDIAAIWSREFPTLLQFVDVEYVSACRFLERLGFILHPPVKYGVAQVPFYPAVRSNNV